MAIATWFAPVYPWMPTNKSSDVRLCRNAPFRTNPMTDHWEIVNANYEKGEFHLEFKDGTQGQLATTQFSALAHATEADFEDLQVSPCGLILENDSIEWDYAEAGLYQLIVESDANSDSEHRCKKIWQCVGWAMPTSGDIANNARLGYEEVRDCAGTGLGLCRMEFIEREGLVLVIVVTTSEAEPMVWNWSLE